ncbi:MAG: ABC transporter permease, partial [Candidatus Saccharimonadales bacterium]
MTRVKQLLLGRETTTLLALVLVLAVFSVLNPAYLTGANFLDILDQATINGLLALGITFVIITGGIDLSVGSVMAVVIVVVGLLMTEFHVPPIVAVPAGIALGIVIGLINGALVTRFKLQPFIATLATMSIFRGVAYIITGGWPVLDMPPSFRAMLDGDLLGAFPIAVIILLAFAAVGHVVLTRTKT